jgi:hypothetical protein
MAVIRHTQLHESLAKRSQSDATFARLESVLVATSLARFVRPASLHTRASLFTRRPGINREPDVIMGLKCAKKDDHGRRVCKDADARESQGRTAGHSVRLAG